MEKEKELVDSRSDEDQFFEMLDNKYSSPKKNKKLDIPITQSVIEELYESVSNTNCKSSMPEISADSENSTNNNEFRSNNFRRNTEKTI